MAYSVSNHLLARMFSLQLLISGTMIVAMHHHCRWPDYTYLPLQDMFLAAILVLDRLVAVPEQAAQISLMAPAMKQMEAVAQILLRKVDTESKYLARLEGETRSTGYISASATCNVQYSTVAAWLHIYYRKQEQLA